MLVTTTMVEPDGVTVTSIGITNGVAIGQLLNDVACAGAAGVALIDTAEPLSNAVGAAGLAGVELHDARSTAMPESSEGAMSLDMGNLRAPRKQTIRQDAETRAI